MTSLRDNTFFAVIEMRDSEGLMVLDSRLQMRSLALRPTARFMWKWK